MPQSHPLESQLALLAAGDLPFWQKLQLGLHLRGCPACRQTVASFAAARRSLASLQSQPLEQQLPHHIRWEDLAAEMQANIRLGLEASQAIAAFDHPSPLADPNQAAQDSRRPSSFHNTPSHNTSSKSNSPLSEDPLAFEIDELTRNYQKQQRARERFLNLRAASIVAGLCLVFGALWWYGVTVPRLERERLAAAKAPVVVEAGSGLVVSHRAGTRLELKAPSNQASFVTVSTGGSADTPYATVGTQYVDQETGQVTITNVYTD